MPTYSYACTECGDRFDAVQAFSDSALTTCDKCNGRLRKLFGNVGVVFKGSGFYRTDSRAKSGASAEKSDKSDKPAPAGGKESTSSSGGDKSSSPSSTTSTTTPAAKAS